MPGRRTATTPFSLGHLKQLSNPAWAVGFTYNMTSDEHSDISNAVVFLRILGFTGSNHRNLDHQGRHMYPRYTVYNMIPYTIAQVPHFDISVPDYGICTVSFPDSQKSRNETVPYSPHNVDRWSPGKKNS